MDKNLVVNPELEGRGERPDGWVTWTPRPELSQVFRFKTDDPKRLVISSSGDKRAFACWRGEVKFEPGKWHRASVRVRLRGVANPSLSVFAQAGRHFLTPKTAWGEETTLEVVFPYTNDADGSAFDLYLRACESGEVDWFEPRVEAIEKPRHRIARVAAVRFGDPVMPDAHRRAPAAEPLTLEMQRERITRKLAEAGALKPDIVCLPEASPIIGVPPEIYESFTAQAEAVPDGPVCRVLSEGAKEHRMYVIAGVAERDGDYVFNTAALFGRDGEFIGRYRKTHLTFYELEWGVSCGEDYPTFDLDFGRVAIHICNDEWFPEISRLYAHKGVEVLFLPEWGGLPHTWRTRAVDNGVYFVASSISQPSMVIDSSGAILAEVKGDGIACADLDLDCRRAYCYGEPNLSFGVPGMAPHMRNTLDNTIIKDLARIMEEA